MKIVKGIFFFVLFCQLVLRSSAQDPAFSQFYSASMFLNPAFAAEKQNMNFTVQHRTNTNKYFVYNLSQVTGIVPLRLEYLNQFFKGHQQSGVALSIYRSASGKNGRLVTLGALGTFAHNVQILKAHYVSFGLQAGFMNMTSNNINKWGTQYDPNVGYDPKIEIDPIVKLSDLRSRFPTINAGCVWFMNNTTLKSYLQKYRFDVFAGISASNINRPNVSFFNGDKTRLPINWKAHGGVKTFINTSFYVYPNVMYLRQNANNQFLFGAYATYKPQEYNDEKSYNAIFGIWYRVGESVIVSVGSAYYNVKFALSYDFLATNKFFYAGRGKGALEASLKYVMPSKKQHLSRGQVYPSF